MNQVHDHTRQTPDDECFWIDGCAIEYGRCDICGSPCDKQGCARDRTHEVSQEETS